MLDRKGLMGWAACAALASAGLTRAGESSGPLLAPEELTLTRPLLLDDTAPAPAPAPSKPLMALLETVGVGKGLEAANINLYGFVEGSYTYSASSPPHNVISGNFFNTKHEKVVLDQADFTVERTVDAAAAAKAGTFDVGFRGEFVYGWDNGLLHSSGIFDNPSTLGVTSGYYRSRTSPENQFDVNQAYIDIALPIGSGLDIRVGKFVTLLGYELINPTQNALFSHSYLFGFAIPLTQTGVLGSYTINDKIAVTAGITRGWSQSLRDNNGSPDFLGGMTYTLDPATKFIVNASVGPQTTHDNHDWWTVIDVIATHKIGDQLTVAFNADYGDAPHAPLFTGEIKSAQWYGAAAYASYVISPMFTLNGRAEWYDDNNGFTVGLAAGSTSYYEGTVGVAITPFPNNDIAKNLVIRPEARFDYASKAVYDGGTDRYQLQAAVDAYFTF